MATRLERPYEDEFGIIVPEVDQASHDLRDRAMAYARARGLDEPECHDSLKKATAKVSASEDFLYGRIHNLKGYLFKVYKQEIHGLLKRDERRRRIENDLCIESHRYNPLNRSGMHWEAAERQVLLQQVMSKIRQEAIRETFDLLLLGHTLAEIARLRNESEDAVRLRLKREISRVSDQLRRPNGFEVVPGVRLSAPGILNKIAARIRRLESTTENG